MFDKVATLGGMWGGKNDHPLANPREMRKILSELPKDNAFKAQDEITGWLESIAGVDDFPADRLYDVAQALEEAAYPHLKRLSREYFQAARLSRSEEKRLWSINYGFWRLLSAAYERCLGRVADRPGAGELPPSVVPVLTARLIAALGAVLKWEQFHYGPMRAALWRPLGQALLAAERVDASEKAVPVIGKTGVTSPVIEYQKVMVFQAASLGSLLPLEIEIAERLIAHFLGGFVFTRTALSDSVYWSDLQVAQPPLRLARMPACATPSQRFIKPAGAHQAMLALLGLLERGGDVPADLDLGGQYQPKLVARVLKHLASYLAPIPPQRKHDRHRVMHRMSVLHGLINAFVVFSGEFGGRPAGLPIESWVVENVSRGGFGAVLGDVPGEWLRVGALIVMQPEGGDNWLIGVVRRYHRESENEARVGIEALSRQANAQEVHVRSASSYGAAATTPVLLLLDGNTAGEVRVILPYGAFSQRESLEYTQEGRSFVLEPVVLLEQTADYELARYRQSVIGIV